MEDKGTLIRNYVLDKLEQTALRAGDKLPGARDLVRETGVSLLTVQNALDALAGEGILETVPRRGTFVHREWKNRVLQRNVVVFHSDIPWVEELRALVRQEIPELWVSQRFQRGVFEIQTTHYVQSHHDEYLDLTGLFKQCFPDTDDFVMKPFDAFRVGERLVGVPILYSPRVLVFNPKLFSAAGCRWPEPGWDWNDFIACIGQLRRSLPPESVFYWHDNVFLWFNFVLRCGGELIDPEAVDPVMIDDERTRRGLRLFRELRCKMALRTPLRHSDYATRFMEGKVAMTIEPREFVSNFRRAGFRDWNVVPLPRIPGGVDCNVQATELLCVRRECINRGAAALLLKLMLSPEFQNRLADWKYGLPIRKSATGRAVDYSDSRDMLFLNEVPKMHSAYNLDSVELYQLVCQGISNLLLGDDDIDAGTAELANMVRTYFKIKAKRQMTA